MNGLKGCRKFQKLTAGSVFGDQQFFTGQGRQETVVSNDFSICLVVDRESFIKVVRQSKDPRDYERFCQIKDVMVFQNNSTYLEKNCLICQSLMHVYTRCPFVQDIHNKPLIVAKFMRSGE